MPHLRFLGCATIQDPPGTAAGLASRRHPLALLALLASTPSRSLSRGKLVGLLWPDSAEQTARNRLNTCVHQVRSAVGNDLLQSVGDELSLAPGMATCDVCQFEQAVAAGEHAQAVEHYGGPFLDGFHLGGSAEFEDHVQAVRERLALAYQASLEALAEAADESGCSEQAVKWWRRRAGEDRYDARVARHLMEALDAMGNRAEALRVAQVHAQGLAEEFGAPPDPQVQALATRLMQAGVATADAAASGTSPRRRKEDRQGTDDRAPASSTIAVLPFDNLSGATDADPFAAGLHDDLLTELSRIKGLTVIARTSVLCYRDSRRTVQEIARELGVASLVEGAVQSSGERLRVNVQLIDVRSGGHLWAESYDRTLSTDSLFDIQSDLVERIVRSLHAELVPADHAFATVTRPTSDLEAYRLHAQGRQQLVQLTDRSLRQAVVHFRAALARDPDYALALIGLADALTALSDYGYEASSKTMIEAEAQAAVRHALALQPSLAETHACRGKLHYVQREGPDAIRELSHAVELMPSYGQAYDWLSWTSQNLGQPGPALDYARRAVELDPLLCEAVSNLAMTLLANGLPEQALTESRRLRQLAPGWTTGAFYEGMALHRLGRFDEMQAVLQGLVVEWAGAGPQAALALACVGSGDTTRARRLQAELENAGEWFSVGLIHAALGEGDAACAAFERVTQWGAYWPTLAVHQYFPDLWVPFAGDARFRGIRANVHRAWGLEADGSFPA